MPDDKKMYQPHFSTATDPRVVQTRESLRRAMLMLLDKKSLEDITVRDITSTAGVGYNTFFRHHQDKAALLEEIAADEIARLINLAEAVLGAGNTNVSAAATTLCEYVADHDVLWSTLLNGGAANVLRREFIKLALDVAAYRAKDISWLPTDAAVQLAASGTIELLSWWLAQKERIPVSQLATIYERVVITPVIAAYI